MEAAGLRSAFSGSAVHDVRVLCDAYEGVGARVRCATLTCCASPERSRLVERTAGRGSEFNVLAKRMRDREADCPRFTVDEWASSTTIRPSTASLCSMLRSGRPRAAAGHPKPFQISLVVLNSYPPSTVAPKINPDQ